MKGHARRAVYRLCLTKHTSMRFAMSVTRTEVFSSSQDTDELEGSLCRLPNLTLTPTNAVGVPTRHLVVRLPLCAARLAPAALSGATAARAATIRSAVATTAVASSTASPVSRHLSCRSRCETLPTSAYCFGRLLRRTLVRRRSHRSVLGSKGAPRPRWGRDGPRCRSWSSVPLTARLL